jgi:hypothetical protein
VSLDDGLSLQTIIQDKELSTHDKHISMLNVLTKAPIDTLQNITDEYITAICDNLPFLKVMSQFYYTLPFRIGCRLFELKDFDSLTVIEFMELEMNAIDEPLESVPRSIELLTIKKRWTLSDIFLRSNIRARHVKGSFQSRLLAQLDFGTALKVMGEFNNWKKKLRADYSVLFEEDPDTDVIDEEPQRVSFRTVSEMWGWSAHLHSICSSKMEFDYWLTKPIKELLAELCYYKQKNTEINRLRHG